MLSCVSPTLRCIEDKSSSRRGRGGVGGGDWIGLDWCFALFGRAIPGSQVTRPIGPMTQTCERPLHVQGP